MPDVAELYGGPPAVDQSGNLTVWAIPGGTAGIDLDQIKVSDLTAASAKRITYSFVPGGYSVTQPQEKNEDERLTSPQRKQSLGKVNPEFSDLEYVDSDDPNSAAVILKAGGSWIFVERRNTPQKTLAAASQIVRAIKVDLGVQDLAPADGTGKFKCRQAAVVEYISARHALSTGS